MSITFEPVVPLPKGYFPSFYDDFFNGSEKLQSLYKNCSINPDWDKLMEEKSNFPLSNRNVLSKCLRDQYKNISNPLVLENIASLENAQTYTVTTGQQIHLFMGPLYFVYKAISVINLAKKLSHKYPKNHFVPVFWMATEDHDFAEIDHISLFGKTQQWQTNQTGPVGRFKLHGIENLLSEIKLLGKLDPIFLENFKIFETAYTQHDTLAEATRYILDYFFGTYGLVAIDADSAELKALLRQAMRADLIQNAIAPAMLAQSLKLKSQKIETILPARESNFFLLSEGARTRIDRNKDGFILQKTNTHISIKEMELWIQNTPEILSPNVAMRPVYQETILPNIAYIAGPGEIQYWLQLYDLFGVCKIPAPALLPRHSVVALPNKFTDWLAANSLSMADFWLTSDQLKANFAEKLLGEKGVGYQKSILSKTLETIYSKLYTQHYADLKKFKNAGNEILRALTAAEKDYEQSIFDVPENKAKLDKMLKFKELYFNTNTPQERTTDFLQNHLTNANWLDEKIQFPELNTTCLYTMF